MITEFESLGGAVAKIGEKGVGISTKYMTEESLFLLLDRIEKTGLQVKSLSLEESDLNRSAIDYIVRKCGKTLESLDLSDNNLQDDAVKAIETLSSLKQLCLDNNFLTRPAIDSLRQHLPQLDFFSAEPSPFTQLEKDPPLVSSLTVSKQIKPNSYTPFLNSRKTEPIQRNGRHHGKTKNRKK